MKMHPSNHHGHGVDKEIAHDFSINATGTVISFRFQPAQKYTFAGDHAKALRLAVNSCSGPMLAHASDGHTFELTGDQCDQLREFLNRCELRTEEEAAALGEPPPESDAGKGRRIDLGDGTHAYGKTPEECAAHEATAKANHERIHAEFLKRQREAAPAPAREPPKDSDE